MRHDDVWVSSVPVEPLFTDIITVVLFRSPFYERAILCFAHVFCLFCPKSLFPMSANRKFRNFSTRRDGFTQKRSADAYFLKVPLTKMRRENPKFRPISSLIATYYAPSLVMRKENRKSKTIVFISDY